MAQTLAEVLAENTKEGELYRRMPDGRIQCFACGHRCPIPEGKAGVCRVRFVKDGKLYVPSGYVGALQDDPIEKKPFFHAMPGVRALSFGMLGCDFHCGYCFTPDTRIATSKGIMPISQIVDQELKIEVYSHTGIKRKIRSFFKRPYHGRVIKIKPAFLPHIECTPEHPFLATLRPDKNQHEVRFIPASALTKDHCFVIPKKYEFSEEQTIKTTDYLNPFMSSYRIKRTVPAETVLFLEADKVRFSKEHAPGIPNEIKMSAELAQLLGFYCAEGSVNIDRNRVHSASLDFSFGKKEEDKVERVRFLIGKIFDVKANIVKRQTTLAVTTGKSSLALLFKALCGERGSKKKVPELLFSAQKDVVQSFLNAYVAGDGYKSRDGQSRISTISYELAWGIAWLVQKMGYPPQFYKYPTIAERELLGRKIKQAPWTYLVRWYETPKKQRHVWEDENYRYVLIEKIENFDYEGPVYNLETEEDHTYLANLTAVHNCQNWVTSQALRDANAVAPPVKIGSHEIVKLARDRDCEVLASTYNEPLITSEWAVEIFREAKQAGLVTAYISNGNGTPEVLDYIRPWVDLYKVDLKSFDDRHYRELGGTLENVCQTIRNLYERKFWLEVLTLLIPGFNSSDDEIKRLTDFLVSVSPDIPWHVTAFHKDYKMTDPENTTARHLLRAAEIGKKAGLKYIYAGNLPGQVKDWENTYCPKCRALLIERFGFEILQDRLTGTGGLCRQCQTKIPGFWKNKTSSRPSENSVRPLL